MSNICIGCKYAKMKKKVCGIYCGKNYSKESDDKCSEYVYYKARNNNVLKIESEEN